MSEGTKIVCMHIPESLHAYVSKLSIENNVSRTKILVRALKYLRDEGVIIKKIVEKKDNY